MSTCPLLDELRRVLHNGHWPAASSPELRAHVGTCTQCSQEVLLTTTLRQARAHAVAAARPISPSLIWWKAQARRRHAAVERAIRPLIAAQIFALVIVLATAGALLARHWHTILGSASAAPASVSDTIGAFGAAPLIAAAVLLTTLGGVALYLTTERR
jgi:hypothetical protein